MFLCVHCGCDVDQCREKDGNVETVVQGAVSSGPNVTSFDGCASVETSTVCGARLCTGTSGDGGRGDGGKGGGI